MTTAAPIRVHPRSSAVPPPHSRPTRIRARGPRVVNGPLKIVDPGEHQQRIATTERVECPVCEVPLMGATIVTDEPEFNEEHARNVVVRHAYCWHCDHLFYWYQASNKDGSQLGELLMMPKDSSVSHGLVRDQKAIARFLTEHPEARGVLQR